TKFTLMYSSHFRTATGELETISSVMPRSIRAVQAGVQEGVFKIGSHGMLHLRENSAIGQLGMDPREFMDLNEEETLRHLQASDSEITRLFTTTAAGFVAPAWGYRPGVTKKIAIQRYSAIVDSSQHVESGDCDVFLHTS